MFRILEYIISKVIKKLHFKAIWNSEIQSTSKVCSGSHLVGVKIGKYSDIGYDCTIIDTIIGAFCSFGSNINVGGAGHTVSWASTSPVFNENKDHLRKKFSHHKFEYSTNTSIGNDVWIGNNVLIKAGVKIGDGVVVGMGSVVTKDIPDYEIWAGNPAKLIKKRFDESTIIELKKMRWWEWDDDKISLYAEWFNNVELLIEKFKSNNKI